MLDAMALFDQHRSIKQGKLNVRLGSEFSGFSAPGKLHEVLDADFREEKPDYR